MKLLIKYGNPYTHDDIFLGIYENTEDAVAHKQLYLQQYPRYAKVVTIIEIDGESQNEEVYLQIYRIEFLGQVYMKPICVTDTIEAEQNEDIIYTKMKVGQLYYKNDFFI